MTAVVARYIELKNSIKEMEDELKIIAPILDDIEAPISMNGYTLSKISVNKTVLKEGVELSQLVEKLGGGVVKQTVNMDFLKESPEAFEFLDIQPSSYLKVTKEKNAKV